MADFAYLIDHLREAWGASQSAFIGFGGSYGGMLGSWFRIQYGSLLAAFPAPRAFLGCPARLSRLALSLSRPPGWPPTIHHHLTLSVRVALSYPNAIDGVIAASAPIWSFVGLDPPYDYNAFNEGVTHDASAAGGSTDACKLNLKAAWPRILGAARSSHGRTVLAKAFRTCSPVRRPTGSWEDDAMRIVSWAEGPWATMAMGALRS